ncbi:5-oxoprolinase/urea amidolyase family protein [Corynebacterium alimapuense]|uniref:Allophanate hydrolase n=1 Tax=Corynebacterium alimapuense TaxID=1576874 RepID=A0A3M8K5R0_9CORY|nr:5-oxoprolinase/urea amidolyase family protein [Corynebacterium alimapuense]RNE48440.1 allophanate hydrolase [Corynebacterium alimapuense]
MTELPLIRPIGSRSVLVDLPDLASVMAWHSELTRCPLPGQIDIIAAARTLLLSTDSPRSALKAAQRLRTFNPAAALSQQAKQVSIDVVYDGADLSLAAELVGMSPESLIAWHTDTDWVGAFGGFAPGFSYCVPANPANALTMPRRDSPRTAVPAGAVALAGDFSAVYPRQSPGGWQLIGTTTTPMWDSTIDPPALVAPGDQVNYRAVREHIHISDHSTKHAEHQVPARPILQLTDPGLLTLIQDLGRAGNGDLGVAESGAADQASARAANAAVGNNSAAAVLENIGGLKLRALADTVVAVTGAQATVSINDRPLSLGSPARISAGETLEVGEANTGLRSYVSVRGGFVAEQTLGSAATDLLSGLGPVPLRDAGVDLNGALLPQGTVGASVANPLRVAKKQGSTHGELRCVPGPRDDWFNEGMAALCSQDWQVSGESNRVGLRLTGMELDRSFDGELPSEGIVAGSIQVPANGLPLVFLRDHATTGGYPVVATVIAEDLDIAGQLPPGSTVRFIPLDPETLAPTTSDCEAEKDQ